MLGLLDSGAPLARVTCSATYHYTQVCETIIAPAALITVQFVYCGKKAMLNVGNVLPLSSLPEGTIVCNVEEKVGDRGALARTSGTSATLIGHALDSAGTRLRLPSGAAPRPRPATKPSWPPCPPPLTPLNKLLLTMALPPRRSLRQPKPLTKAAMRLSRWWLVAAERHTLENEARGTRTQEPPRWPCSWRPQHTAYQEPIMSDQGVGIVIVSHSCPLGRAAADLASQMLPGPEIPPIEVAAGLDDTTLGTWLLYTSDAADDSLRVDLSGRRIL